MSDEPTSKPELIARINERWDALQALVAKLDAAGMERPLGDGWSAKVHLAHVAAWERSLMGILRKGNRAEAMGLPQEVWDAHDLEATNGVLATSADHRPLDTVLAESAAIHATLMALLESLTQEDLEKPYSHYQPADLPFNPNPVVGWVHGNTWDHYNEHIGWLEAGIRG